MLSPAKWLRARQPLAALAAGLLWLGLQLAPLPAQAQQLPSVSPSLKKMLGGLPINESKEALQQMLGALKQTSCGGGLKGCYMTQSGPMQLYLFSTQPGQQTLLLVLDKKIAMPHLLKGPLQNLFGGTGLASPIISISTTDYTLEAAKMPPPLQQVMRDRYFGALAMEFASGVQIASRADLGGAMKLLMLSYGIDISKLTMRAAVVMPIPEDLVGGAATGVAAADAVAHGDSMKKAGLDALKPETFVEFQFPPGASFKLVLPKLVLSDATFFINNELVFGFKGNALFDGVDNKRILTQFQTPLSPQGAMDLLDFSFRMATPPTLTLEDYAKLMVAMATPDPRLAPFGGGFIRNIESIKQPLLLATKPLSVFQVRNPVPQPDYRFGDPSRPFPTDDKAFNIVIAGPTADGGPLLVAKGSAYILGQKMGWIDVRADVKGFDGSAVEDLSLKLGPLGKVTVQKIIAQAQINKGTQMIRLKGNYYGQVVEVLLDGDQMTLNVPANCVNPFEIKAKLGFTPSTNIADVFDAQGGVNVDPSKIAGCVGKELEAALRKISTEYKNMAGYSAKEANQALSQMSGTAEYAAAQAQKQAEAAAAAAAAEAARQAEAARKAYDSAKNAARDAATKSASSAARAFADAGNAFKRIGKKKHKKSAPDPRFDTTVFDWDYYYDHAPDVVAAKADLATHWRDNGFNEGRRGSLVFDVRYYWNRYTDVQQRCGRNDLQCALQHWLSYGIEQGRQGSADFSVVSYLNRYPDLQNAFGQNYDDALDHWFNSGEDEGRNGRPELATAGPVAGYQNAGGDGGSPWSDRDICKDGYLDGIRVKSGKTVDWVQFRYGSRGWNVPRGALGAKGGYTEVTLPAGEYFVRVDYRGGARVDQVKFITNTGRVVGPWGGGGGSPGTYLVTPGEKLGCMTGHQGSELDHLTFSSTGPR
jgi:hypothetical protein